MKSFTNIIFSSVPPKYKNCLWGRPMNDGFALYWLSGGRWLPLKLVNDNGTSNLNDDYAYGGYEFIGNFG